MYSAAVPDPRATKARPGARIRAMLDGRSLLWPPPLAVERSGGELVLRGPISVRAEGSACAPARAPLERALGEAGLSLVEAGGAEAGELAIELALDPGLPEGAQGYVLAIEERGARLVGRDPAGLFHGAQTLAQLVRGSRAQGGGADPDEGPAGAVRLARCVVRDRPAFQQRGVLLDVSRDRVPTTETLFALVELLASWKVNQLQLYMEHTFAYRGHEQVWRGADPLTEGEVRALDRHCAAHFIELVPNQQSFGHFHRWLVHERYRPLAECPEGVEHPFVRAGRREREPFSLCPLDPGSLALLSGLYDQLLPCFRSRTVHVGLDETFDLGQCRSRAACAERGAGRVYLEFLLAVHALVRERGHRMQFWADILLHHPELVRELPRDAVPCLWGYEADHPFEAETRALAESGLEFLVCPGTSSWQSIAGRLANMSANILRAVRHARAGGAAGILVTDWGDRGHLQPLPASYPGWLLAAGMSWNPDGAAPSATPERLAELLSRHALADDSGNAGRALVRLAAAGEATRARARNASPLFLVLSLFDQPFPPPAIQGLSAEGLERSIGELDSALALLPDQRMRCPDAVLVERELTWSAGLLRWCALLGLQRLRRGTGPVSDIPSDVRVPLAAELEALAEEHRALWLARSRRGGLERSSEWLELPLAALQDGQP